MCHAIMLTSMTKYKLTRINCNCIMHSWHSSASMWQICCQAQSELKLSRTVLALLSMFPLIHPFAHARLYRCSNSTDPFGFTWWRETIENMRVAPRGWRAAGPDDGQAISPGYPPLPPLHTDFWSERLAFGARN